MTTGMVSSALDSIDFNSRTVIEGGPLEFLECWVIGIISFQDYGVVGGGLFIHVIRSCGYETE